MIFEDLTYRLRELTLTEKYYKYSIPTTSTKTGEGLKGAADKKYLMYDFYVLDYLNFLVNEMPPKQFRDLPEDLEQSVKDSVNTLFPYLRDELLNAVFYAICAEMRYVKEYLHDNMKVLEKGTKGRVLLLSYLKYLKIKNELSPENIEILGLRTPSSSVRPPSSEKDNQHARNISYKAAFYSIKKNNASKKDFIEMCGTLFENGKWSSSYGGKAWANICKGWLMLYNSEKITPNVKQSSDPTEVSNVKPLNVAIDHIYDLQHNTDTVFNKLESYFSKSGNSGYRWIKQALDHKANVRSYHDLLKHASGSVRAMALPILYNRLGETWEKNLRDNHPSKLYSPASKSYTSLEDAFNQAVSNGTDTTPSTDTIPIKIGDKLEKGEKLIVVNSPQYTSPIKNGDIVVVVRSTTVDSSNMLIKIKTQLGNISEYYASRFAKIKSESTQNEPSVASSDVTKTQANPQTQTNHFEYNGKKAIPLKVGDEFKVGDKLMIINASQSSLKVGDIVTVDQNIKITHTSDYIYINTDTNKHVNYYIYRFGKLVREKKNSTKPNVDLSMYTPFEKGSKIFIGDKIICIKMSRFGNYGVPGRVYTVEKTTPTNPDNIFVAVDGINGSVDMRRFSMYEFNDIKI